MITFRQLTIEGFGSIQAEFKLELNDPGITLVRGKNGAGKTTIWSALLWCLYGITSKGTPGTKVATWENLRGPEFKGTRVMLDLTVNGMDYLIARHLDYKGNTLGKRGGSNLVIAKQGIQIEELGKTGQQEYITKLMGMDSTIFVNAVMFNQRHTRLSEVSDAEKRKVFEELFELEFIARAKDNGKERIASLKVEQAAAEANSQRYEAELSSTKARIEDRKNVLIQWRQTQEKRRLELQNTLDYEKQQAQNAEAEMKRLHETTETILGDLEKALLSVGSAEVGVEVAQKQVDKAPKEDSTEMQDLTDKLQEAKAEVRRIRAEYQEHESKHLAAERKRAQASAACKEYEQKLAAVTDTCPSCAQPLPSASVEQTKEKLQKEIDAYLKEQMDAVAEGKIHAASMKTLEEAEVQADAQVESISAALLEAKKVSSMVPEYQRQLAAAKQQLASAQQVAEGFKTQIERLKQQQEATQVQLDRHRKNIPDAEFRLADLEKEMPPDANTQELEQRVAQLLLDIKAQNDTAAKLERHIEQYKWWVDVAFGSAGVKAYVFEAMLRLLNAAVDKYAQRLGIELKFGVDMSKASKPFVTEIRKRGTLAQYDELSGGEKQRCDICLAFALHDLVSGLNPTNILILDEVLEGIDSEGGTEEVFDLIRSKAGNSRSVFVITHQIGVDTQYAKELVLSNDTTTTIA